MKAYAAMLPRLEAEEALAAASVTALGSGTMKPAEAARMRQQLTRRAGPAAPAAKADRAALGLIGIRVVRGSADG